MNEWNDLMADVDISGYPLLNIVCYNWGYIIETFQATVVVGQAVASPTAEYEIPGSIPGLGDVLLLRFL